MRRITSRASSLILALLVLSASAAPGGSYDPSTLVYPTFKHDLGFHHVNDTHLRIFTGNKHRFRQPRGVAAVKLIERDRADEEGDDDELTVYGINSGEHCVIYNTSQTSIAVYGEKGSGKGRFLRPWGIAANPEGDVYVADTGNDRIVHLRYRRGALREVKTFGAAKGDTVSFRSPRGVALANDGDLYVADHGNDRVVILDRAGRLLRVIDGDPPFQGPEAIAVLDSEERWSYRKAEFLVVVDRNGKRVRKLSMNGGALETASAADLGFPNARFRGAAIDYHHQVWLTDEANHKIHKLDHRLRPMTTFGREGGGDKEFHSPFGIALWRRFGQLFISERTGAQYYWVGVDILGYHGEPAVFKGIGRIVFTLTERGKVTVVVSDKKGRAVRTIVEDRYFGPGRRSVHWDGMDDEGNRLPPGRYQVRIGARASYSSSKHFQKEVEFLVTLG